MDKISVIVPIYNTCDYVEKCIESLLSQTYPDIEIILVNDGSTDSSDAVCKKYAAEHDNIKYYSLEQNHGLSYARNFGIGKASGNYLGFVDSDDWIEPDMYSLLLSAMKKHNTKLASSLFYQAWHENGEIKRSEIRKSGEDIYFPNPVDAMIYYVERYDIMVTNRLFARDLFDDIEFPVGKVYEDSCIAHLLIEKSGSAIVVKKHLYNHYIRNNSITHSGFSVKQFDYLEFQIFRYDYIAGKYDSAELEKLCRRRVFETLLEMSTSVNHININESNDINDKYKALRKHIYDNYSYENCDLSEKELKLAKALEKSLTNFKIAHDYLNTWYS